MHKRLLGWYSSGMQRLLLGLLREDGATLVEYGVLLMLVALVVLSAIALIGPELSSIFGNVAAAFLPKGSGH